MRDGFVPIPSMGRPTRGRPPGFISWQEEAERARANGSRSMRKACREHTRLAKMRKSAGETCDGHDYCDGCGKFGPVWAGAVQQTGKLVDIYQNGKPGYYCKNCLGKRQERV